MKTHTYRRRQHRGFRPRNKQLEPGNGTLQVPVLKPGECFYDCGGKDGQHMEGCPNHPDYVPRKYEPMQEPDFDAKYRRWEREMQETEKTR